MNFTARLDKVLREWHQIDASVDQYLDTGNLPQLINDIAVNLKVAADDVDNRYRKTTELFRSLYYDENRAVTFNSAHDLFHINNQPTQLWSYIYTLTHTISRSFLVYGAVGIFSFEFRFSHHQREGNSQGMRDCLNDTIGRTEDALTKLKKNIVPARSELNKLDGIDRKAYDKMDDLLNSVEKYIDYLQHVYDYLQQYVAKGVV